MMFAVTFANQSCIFVPAVVHRSQHAALFLCLNWLDFPEARHNSATYTRHVRKENCSVRRTPNFFHYKT